MTTGSNVVCIAFERGLHAVSNTEGDARPPQRGEEFTPLGDWVFAVVMRCRNQIVLIERQQAEEPEGE